MRKLVSIKKITALEPIEGADLIEVAVIDNGWKCVVKKGEFEKEDLGVYFEIDSFLPIKEEFEFLRKSSFKKMEDKEGFRLKTIKLRGITSQGLVLPLDKIITLLEGKEYSLEEGTDLTELLEVEKYEAPIPACLSGQVNGDFPSFIRKTDQERIQNLWSSHSRKFNDNNEKIIEELEKMELTNNSIGLYSERIEELKTNRVLNKVRELEFEATIKLDGTSMTMFVIDTDKFSTKHTDKRREEGNLNKIFFGVCGRNFELTESDGNSLWKEANKYKSKIIDFMNRTNRNIAIQGELMGEGIQKNREKLRGQKFFCYDIWDIDEQRYLTSNERNEIIKELGIESVPYLETFKVFERFNSIEEILDYAEGDSINNPVREGVVFKSTTLINGHTISFKAISNKFLLKGGD